MRHRKLKRANQRITEPVRYRGLAGVCAAVLVLSLVASVGLSSRAGETDPLSMTLYAGKDIPVGDVTVWNDCEWLHVTYEVYPDSDWYLKETHLEVAASLDAIPQVNGNPVPGKFTYAGYYDELIKEVTYEVPLEDAWNAGDTLYVAAHAVVSEYVLDCGDGLWWASGVLGFDQGLRKDGSAVLPERSDPANALGEPDYEGSTVTFVSLGFGGSIVLSFDHPVANCLGDDVAAFEVTNGRYPLEQVDVYAIVGDTETYIGTVQNTPLADQPAEDWVAIPDDMFCIDAVKLVDVSESSLFELTADGYDLDALGVTGVCMYLGDESAWAGTGVGTLDFPGKNWATYFTYEVEGCWDISGDWVIRVYYGGTYDHDYTISVTTCCEEYEATGGYPATGPPYSIVEEATFTVTGTSVEFHSVYYNPTTMVATGYEWWGTGTIDTSDGSMSGTWASSAGQVGTWESISGQAVLRP